MKFSKYFLIKLGKLIKSILVRFSVLFIICVFSFILFFADGYTLEDLGFDGVTLNPSDYCNLTDVDYTAILHDDPDGKANVEITEYLTFDVHASSRNNTYKELWRELPEDVVDGLRVTYDVKSVSQIVDGIEIPYEETTKMYWEDEDYTQDATMYWHHSKGTGYYPDNDESVLIYIPWTYREKMKFKIVYSMNNAALKYKDCSELYLSLYSGNTITKLKSYKAQILIPNKLMPANYYSYSFGTVNSRIPYTESDTINPKYHTFSINLDEDDLKFNYHNRYIEFCLLAYGPDKHIFTKYAPNNDYSDEDALDECIEENEYYENQTTTFNNIKKIVFGSSIGISALIVYFTFRKYTKTKEKYNFYEPENNYEYYRDIPSDLDPMFASELVFMKDPFDTNKEKKEEYSAILLSLVRKKYVTLSKVNETSDWSDSNTLITLEPIQTTSSTPEFEDTPNYSPEPIYTTINANTGETVEALSTSERLYFELLSKFALNRPITIKQFQQCLDTDYIHTNSFVKEMEKKPILENGVAQGYFQNAKYDVVKKDFETSANTSLIFSLILLILVNLISYFTPLSLAFGAYTILGVTYLWKYFYLGSKANNLILFSQFGANEQAKWYGLYKFLNSDTLIKEKQVHELPLWEKYLIYATAFGISEKVIKAIKINAINVDINKSLILNNHCYIHSHCFHSTSRALGRSIHTSSRGGGHGYGGGGRGGRWWWRWSLNHHTNKRAKCSLISLHCTVLSFRFVHFSKSFKFKLFKLIFNSLSIFLLLKVL